jgi:hypothetical protein
VAACHQEVDIPLETAKVIQHDLHEVACGCERVHGLASSPDGSLVTAHGWIRSKYTAMVMRASAWN